MSEASGDDDQAWISVETGLDYERLRAICRDPERMLRINPLLEFRRFEQVTDGRWAMVGRNLSNGHLFDLEFGFSATAEGFTFVYEGGLKRSTTLSLQPTGDTTLLKITDDYSGLDESEKHRRIDEVDRSLVPWGEALHRYLRQWRRWSWLLPWRWYMQRVWQPMKPSARRIARLIIWITVLEFVAFLMVFAIFWLELDQLLRL